MALFHYHCPVCGADERHLERKPSDRLCKACQKPLTRAPRPPSSRVVERLDNGLMVKALERLADAPELHRARHDKHIAEYEKPPKGD